MKLVKHLSIFLALIMCMSVAYAKTKITSSNVKLSKTSFTVQYKPNSDRETIVKAQKPSVTVKKGTKKLKKGTDYYLKWKNSSSGNAGSYYVKVIGKGKYKGTIRKNYKINPITLTSKNVYLTHETEEFVYDGEQQVPKYFTVVFKQNGGLFELKQGKHYTSSKFSVTGNQTTVGQKIVTKTISGKGNFKGSVQLTDKYVIYPTKPSFELTGGNGSIKIEWEKSSGAVSGYGVFYWNKTLFGKAYVDSKTTKTTLKSLKAGRYYVTVIPYITINKDRMWPEFGPDDMESVEVN